MRYVRNVEQLAPGGQALIYGSGGRGESVFHALRDRRPDIAIAGFLDSAKSGSHLSLPVIPIGEYLSRREAQPPGDAVIIIASSSHRSIAKSLEHRGIKDFYIYLDADECDPCFRLPETAVLENLGSHRHPLAIAGNPKETGEAIYYHCCKFSSMYLRPTGISPCCWIPDLVEVGSPEQTLDRVMALSHEFFSHAHDGLNAYCLRCPELIRSASPRTSTKLTNVDIDTSIKCNLKCRYCRVVNTENFVYYDYKNLLDYALCHDYFEKEFSFSWGGFGEPVINKDFDAIVDNFLSRNALGLIYTNAVQYSGVIEAGLRAGLITIQPSLDAGSEEKYRYMRGADKFNTVWRNIEKYVRANVNNVIVKYIVTDENCDFTEIANFIDRCTRAGIKKIGISKDFFTADTNERVQSGIVHAARLARSKGIGYFFLSTAVSEKMAAALEAAVMAGEGPGAATPRA